MKELFANGIEPADNTPLTQQEVIDDLIAKKKAGAYGTRVQEANELYQQKKNDAEVNDQTLSAIEQSAEKTKQVIDHTKYASLLDPYDLSENPTDGELLAKWDNLSPADKKEFNRANGYTGMYPYGFQRDVMDSYASSIKQQREDAEKAAAQAAADEANAPIKVENGTDTPYEVTKDFSDWYKQWEVAYTSTNNAATRANLVQQLSAKMSEAGLPSKDVVPAGKDAQGNPVDPFVSYMEQFLGDGTGDFTQFNSFQKVLEAAKQDRTPKQPEQKSWEDRWFEHQAKQYALERDQEQRRLKGQMLGRGIGDLAATIGDMVRASEGAPVTQRDWQKYYDQLTAQEQANVNNYRIRMQKLAEDQMKLHQQQKAPAAAAAEKAAERKAKAEEAEKARQWKSEEDAAWRQLRWYIANLQKKNAYNIALLQYGNGAKKGGADIVIGDKRYHFKTAYDLEAFINAFDGIIRDKANYPAGAKVPTVNIQDNWDTQRRKQELQNFVIGYFTSEAWKNAPKAVKDKIAEEIKKNAYRLVADETPAITIDGAEQTSSAGSATPVVLTPQDSAQISTNLLNLFNTNKKR